MLALKLAVAAANSASVTYPVSKLELNSSKSYILVLNDPLAVKKLLDNDAILALFVVIRVSKDAELLIKLELNVAILALLVVILVSKDALSVK